MQERIALFVCVNHSSELILWMQCVDWMS